VRETSRLATSEPIALEVRARSRRACSASCDELSAPRLASVAISRHSRRVMPKRPSHNRMTMLPATDSSRLMR